MPASYAHYIFGRKVLSKLSGEVLNIVGDNMDLFNIGLYGPDILFYYRPYIRNHVNKLGTTIHAHRADNFFTHSKIIITSSENYKAPLSYIMGFICHFILDSRCHPFINNKIAGSGFAHSKIETEFDKELIRRHDKSLKGTILTEPIIINDANIKTVAPFFNLSFCEIKESLSSMKFYSSMFVDLSEIKRRIISKVLKASKYHDELMGAFYSKTDEPLLNESNNALCKLLSESAAPAAETIMEYLDTLYSSSTPSAFNRCFD